MSRAATPWPEAVHTQTITLGGTTLATQPPPTWVRDQLLQQVDTLLVELHNAFEQARTDSLTGLSNRRAFLERLETECASAQRHGRPLTLVILDIDDLRAVNSVFGHFEGDRVVRATAAAVATKLRGCVAAAAGEVVSGTLLQTVSVGWATLLEGESPASLFRRADAHLYEGRNARQPSETAPA